MPSDKIDRNAPGAVFVGNISYDTSEQDLHNIMSEVGPIKAIKLVINRDTGSHKGFGFVEYHSEAHAKSAMANLAGKDLNGRKIRVDFANQSSSSRRSDTHAQASGGGGDFGAGGGGGDFVGGSAGGGGGARRANQVPAGPSQHEAVRNALGGLTVYQLYDVLKQMKELCQKKPKDAERILLSKPSLAQALLQAQHMLGMVHTSPAGLDLPTDPSVQLPGSEGGANANGLAASAAPSSSKACEGAFCARGGHRSSPSASTKWAAQYTPAAPTWPATSPTTCTKQGRASSWSHGGAKLRVQ